MPREMRDGTMWWLALAVAVMASGCGPRTSILAVDLRTDLVPGVDVFAAQTTLVAAGTERSETSPRQRSGLDDASDPDAGLDPDHRIAEFVDLSPGDYRAVVELLDTFDEVLLTRSVDVHVSGTYAITVVVTRDCVFLGCPDTGDPETDTECFGGACVSPACTDGHCASPECQTNGDCPMPIADCAVGVCSETGVCLQAVVRGACEDGTACSPDDGCVEIPVTGTGEDLDGDGAIGPDDCRPLDPTIYAGAPETCGDGIDQNCDARDLPCAIDADGDGFGSDWDCDDGDPAIHPDAVDGCDDRVDQDCDGYDTPCAIVNADGDNWPLPNDCNDGDPLTYPSAFDTCGDRIDQDCSGADAVCVGGYGQRCGPRGTCLTTSRARLSCTRANGSTQRQCLHCCVRCATHERFHWLNVDHDCTPTAERYCARNGRGGLYERTGVDPIQWGTCAR